MNTNTTIATDLISYTLVDGEGQEVGPINSIWNGTNGTPEFLGVHVGPVAGTHLVPLSVARVDRDTHLVRVDAMKDTIENTRHFSPGDELSSQDRWETYHDWGVESPEPGAPNPYQADVQAGKVDGDSMEAGTGVNPV